MADSAIDGIFDLTKRYSTNSTSTDYDPTINYWGEKEEHDKLYEDKSTLSFTDMLSLMVTQFQNQTIDNQADTNDMMNQLIQMTVMQALTEMSTQVEDLTNANIMSYSASLVGKEVTVGVLDSRTGKLTDEIVGTVTATGTYNGQQVIFIGDKYFPLSSIMAVGKLPEEAVDGTETKPGDSGDEDSGKVEGGENAGDNGGDESAPVGGTGDENKPIEETGGDQEPKLPIEDYEEGGTDAAERVNGTEAI